jgi:hypothetical protein
MTICAPTAFYGTVPRGGGGCRQPATSNLVPTDIKPRILNAIDLDGGTTSLKQVLRVASHFELDGDEAYKIAGQLGPVVTMWRKVAAKVGISPPEIDRMATFANFVPF